MKKVIITTLLVLFWYCVCYGEEQNPSNLGNIMGNTAIQKYGSQGGMNEHLFKPIMSDGVNMKTLDGSKEFSANLLCPSSSRFLEVLVQPGSSGDITTLIVSQDMDFNGTLDYTYQVPVIVSGVCSNGVISCETGTWNFCRAFRWATDTSGKIVLEETLNTNLGGCYCINNSCGNNLVFNNIDTVIRSVGGGVVAAIHEQNSRYVVSGVKIDGMLASYYGQNAGGCTTVASSSGATDLEKYYYSPYSMEADAQSTIAAQKSDPDSMYNLMDQALENTQAEEKNCFIIRSVSTDWAQRGNCELIEVIQNRCENIENDPKCTLKEETVDSVQTFANYKATGLSPAASCIDITETMTASCAYVCPDNINIPCIGDPPVCSVGETSKACVLMHPIISAQKKCGYGMDGSVSGSNVVDLSCGRIEFAPGVTVTGSAYGSGGCGAPAFAANCSSDPASCSGCPAGTTSVFGWRPYCEPYYENVCVEYGTDCYYTEYGTQECNCLRYEQQYVENCINNNKAKFCVKGLRASMTGTGSFGSMYSAYIQDVYTTNGFDLHFDTIGCCVGGACAYTYAPYAFSGYVCPLEGAQCVGVPGYCSKTCSQDVCRDWWRKDRVYTCTHGGYDFSEYKERLKTIKDSTADNVSNFSYRDYRKTKDGTWQYEDKTIDTSGVMRPSTSSCEMACKTRRPKDNTATSITDKTTDFRNNSSSYDFFYKSCRDGVCPVGTNEEVLKECQCINEFAEAALIMQVIRSAGQDFLCSSGKKSSLK